MAKTSFYWQKCQPRLGCDAACCGAAKGQPDCTELSRWQWGRELHAELHQFSAQESFEHSWSATLCHKNVQFEVSHPKPTVLRVSGWSFMSQKLPELFFVMAAVAPLIGPGVSLEGGGRGGTG